MPRLAPIVHKGQIMEEETYERRDNHTPGHSAVLSHHEKYVILMTLCAGGIAAIFVSMIAMTMAIKFKLHKYFVHRLAIYQVLSAMFYSSLCVVEVIFINYDKNTSVYHPICVIEAFVLEYAVWIKLLFTFCLTFHLFCFSICHINYSRLEIAYVLVSILGPALFSWIPFIHGLYGEAGAWCWIQNWKDNNATNKLPLGEIEQYALYGVAMTCLLLCGAAVVVVSVILICRAYNCRSKCCSNAEGDYNDEHQPLLKDKQRKVLREILPLVSYPILSLLLYIPSFINRIIGSIFQTPIMIGFMWSAVTLPLVGLFAGVSLIFHIFILECPKRKVGKKQQLLIDTRAAAGIKNVTDLFTTETVASTAARSHFEPPPESAIDEELMN